MAIGISSDDVSFTELDYHLVPGAVVMVEEKGDSDNIFESEIGEYVETDVADGLDAKVYSATVTKVHEGDYSEGDTVHVDNRDVEMIYSSPFMN